MRKRLTTIICMLLFLFASFVVTEQVYATETNSTEAIIIQSGKCGDDVYFTLDNEGTLTIRGNGQMWNMFSDNGIREEGMHKNPWKNSIDLIKNVVFP